MHEDGLGVLAVSAELEGPVRDLCQLRDPATTACIHDRFAQSGLRCMATSSEAVTRAVQGRIEAPTAKAYRADRLHFVALAGEKRAAVLWQTLEARIAGVGTSVFLSSPAPAPLGITARPSLLAS